MSNYIIIGGRKLTSSQSIWASDLGFARPWFGKRLEIRWSKLSPLTHNWEWGFAQSGTEHLLYLGRFFISWQILQGL